MTVATTLKLTSPAFADGQAIPAKHTCGGDDVSPPLTWEAGPPGTAAWALIVEDPDARAWVHWVVANLPAEVTFLQENASGHLPTGAVEGATDFGPAGWRGPCPPDGEHRYVFTLYALSEPVILGAEIFAAPLKAAMFGKVLAQGTLTGTYRR